MRKISKDNIGLVIAIVSVAVVVGLIWNAIISLKPPDKAETEKYLKRDKADLVLITKYFNDSCYPYISINEFNYKEGEMFTGLATHDVKIENEAVIKAIKRIFKRGYNSILKQGNTVSFEKWRFGEECHGIAYSINKEDKTVLQYLTELEPLSEKGWYYYVEDYNEWRS